jgi:plasmid maintenance system antidote protein VapI
MLAVVKKPRIELSIHGEKAGELLAWIRKRYEVEILSNDDSGRAGESYGDTDEEALIPIESTEFWQEMNRNRIGNLLAGARLKTGMTQAELAKRLGIRQNMVSDYERGRRTYSNEMAGRLSGVLDVREDQITYGDRDARNTQKTQDEAE